MTLQSIVNESRGRSINVRETMQQIGGQILMSVGYQPKTLVYDVDYVKFKVSRRYWLTIKLNANDEFDVEVASVRKTEYKVIEQVKDVPVESLRSIVLKVGDRA